MYTSILYAACTTARFHVWFALFSLCAAFCSPCVWYISCLLLCASFSFCFVSSYTDMFCMLFSCCWYCLLYYCCAFCFDFVFCCIFALFLSCYFGSSFFLFRSLQQVPVALTSNHHPMRHPNQGTHFGTHQSRRHHTEVKHQNFATCLLDKPHKYRSHLWHPPTWEDQKMRGKGVRKQTDPHRSKPWILCWRIEENSRGQPRCIKPAWRVCHGWLWFPNQVTAWSKCH